MILAQLAAVESADLLHTRTNRLTPRKSSTHLSRLEESEYIKVNKDLLTRFHELSTDSTDEGKKAIQKYRENMRQVIDRLVAQDNYIIREERFR